MEIIYTSDIIEIKSYDFISKTNLDMIDFFIIYKNVEYSCSAFSLDYINKIMANKENMYFWSISSIIIKEGTRDCLIESVLGIIHDKSLLIDDIFIKSNK